MKMNVLFAFALLAGPAFAASARAADHQHADAKVTNAVAVITPTKASDGKVQGIVRLKQEQGYVLLTGQVTGLTPGKHGFHIHRYGDISAADGTSAGGHYNPTGEPHGGRHSEARHDGDLGNITANAQGTAHVEMKAPGLKLHNVLGRSIVVHGGADDLESQPSGNAGPRVGAGVIGLAAERTATAAK